MLCLKYSEFQNDLEARNLFNKVKKCILFKINFNDLEGKDPREPIITLKEKFTESGLIKEAEYFDNFGKQTQIVNNFYNNSGYLVKSIVTTDDNSHNTIEVIEHDTLNKIRTSDFVLNDTLSFKSISKFNDSDRIVSLILIEKLDTVMTTYRREFNENGKIVLEEAINDKKSSGIVRYKYDDFGNVIKIVNESDYIKLKTVFEYKNQKLIKEKNYTIAADGTEYINEEITYDNYYNPIRKKVFEKNELYREFKNRYEFDIKGNWVKKEVYTKEKFSDNPKKFYTAYFETRDIEYW